MKALVVIFGIINWTISMCVRISIWLIGLAVYHWTLNQIQLTYPNQIHGLFKVVFIIGCVLLCSFVIYKVDKKDIIKVKITETKTEEL